MLPSNQSWNSGNFTTNKWPDSRASNEDSRRYHNHEEGHYLGLILVESAFTFEILSRHMLNRCSLIQEKEKALVGASSVNVRSSRRFI